MNAELAMEIVEQARAMKVDPRVALAFAFAESDVENVVGDTELHKRPGYMQALRAEMPPGQPGLDEPEAWASYGPFQLQARWYVREGEHPHVLLEPSISIPRAIATIRNRLARASGNEVAARVAYVCGHAGNCSPEKRQQIERRYLEADQKARRYLERPRGERFFQDLFSQQPKTLPRAVLVAGMLLAYAMYTLLNEPKGDA